MNTATKVRDIGGTMADAVLWRLSKAIPYGCNDPETTTDHIVSSRIDSSYGEECYLFPADAEGHVLNWSELPGSRKGAYTHEDVIADQWVIVQQVTK